MTWWEAVVLGVVQALTEYIPVSSSAHVRILGPLLPSGGDPGAAFTATIQLGTELAVLIYFRHDIARIVRGWWGALRGLDGTDRRSRLGAHNAQARLGWWVIVGTIPIVVCGVLFAHSIENTMRHLYITATTLILFGLLLGWADRYGKRVREIETLRARDAIALGLAQAAALIPGVSRAGGTITMGLLLGLTREAAARYSFLLAIPAILGSAGFELATNAGEITAATGPGIPATIIATLVSFVLGYFVIIGFLTLISKYSYMPFVIYRVALGIAIFVLVGVGVVPALN